MMDFTGMRISRSMPPMRRALWLAGLLIAAILAAFGETLVGMVAVWVGSRTYNHGFLILPIVLYLVWLRRDRLQAMTPRASALGLLWLAGAGALWLAGELAQANVVQHISLVLMLQGAVLTVFGPAFSRALLFPLAYLLFMVPFGDFAIEPLQALTANYTTILVRAMGVPIYLENWIIVIPGGSFLVAEACSGVRFLIATVALSALAANLLFERGWKRALFMLFAFLVPIAANVVRATGIVMVAWWSDFELAVGIDHIVYGFIFLSIVLLIMIAIAWWLRDPLPEQTAPAPRLARADLPASFRSLALPAGAAALLVLTRLLGDLANAPHDVPSVDLAAPALDGGWTLRAAETGWQGHFPRADAARTWLLERDGERWRLFIAWYADEFRGKELVAFHNTLSGTRDAVPIEAGILRDWPLADIPPPGWLALDGRQGARAVWYWYRVDGKTMARARSAKLASMVGKLRGGDMPAAAIAIAGDGDPRDGARLARMLVDSGLDKLLRGDGPSILVEPVETP